MFLAVIRTEESFGFIGAGYMVFLLLLMFVLLLARSLEIKLLILGLLTALLSAWIAVASHATEMGPILAGHEVTGTLSRISVLLILCGVAVIGLNRLATPGETTSKEGSPHG